MAETPVFDPNKPSTLVTTQPVFNPDRPSTLVEETGSYFSGAQGAVPDVAEEIGKGIYTGVVSLPQGISELGAMTIDGIFDTNISEDVHNAFEYIKPEITSTAGQVTEGLVSFGVGFIPISGWVGKAGQAARLAKAGKLSQAKNLAKGRGKFTKSAVEFGSSKAGQTVLNNWTGRTGAYAIGSAGLGFSISPEGRATLSDNFSIIPGQGFLQTEEEAGLTGREEAGRNFRNRLRLGVEDGILSVGFDSLLKVGADAAKTFGRSDYGLVTAQGLRQIPETASQGFVEGMAAIGLDRSKVITTMAGANRKFKEYFSASRGADEGIFETAQDADALVSMYKTSGIKAAKEFEQAQEKFIEQAKIAGSPTRASQVQEALTLYLRGDYTALDKFKSEALKDSADRMINVQSELDERILAQLEAEIGLEVNPSTNEKIMDMATGRPKLQKLGSNPTPRMKKAYEALYEIRRSQKAGKNYLRRYYKQYTDPKSFYKNLDLDDPRYQGAINEVALHTSGSMGRSVNDPVVIANAKSVVNESLGLGTQAGKTPEQSLAALRSGVADVANLSLPFKKTRPKFSTIDDLFTPQKDILTASPSLRALKGQLTDPLEIYKRTITDMANTSVAADFYKSLAAPSSGFKTGLFDAVTSLNSGGRPIIVQLPDRLRMTDEQYDAALQPFREKARSGENVVLPVGTRRTAEDFVEIYRKELAEKNSYVTLGDTDINNVFKGNYGDLSGTMVSPETYSALSAPLRLNSGFLGEAAGIMSYARSLSQKMTIVPNTGAQVRQIAGNMGMLAGNANLGRDTDFSEVFKLFTSSLQRLDDQGLTRLARVVSESGVSDTSLVLRALKEYKKAGEDLRLTGALQRGSDYIVDKIPFMQFFEKLYTSSDSFFKTVALLAEEDKLLNAMAAAGIKENDPNFVEAMFTNGLSKRPTASSSLPGNSLTQTETLWAGVSRKCLLK